MSERLMFDEFDGLDATEKAGIVAALNRCRALAAKIANKLRNKRPERVAVAGRDAYAIRALPDLCRGRPGLPRCHA